MRVSQFDDAEQSPGLPRHQMFVSGRDPTGSRYLGITRGGVARGIQSMGRYRRGLNHHGIGREYLGEFEISRQCKTRY